MTTSENKPATKTSTKKSATKIPALPTKKTSVAQSIQNHLVFSCFKTNNAATPRDWYEATAHTVRDHVVERWIRTSDAYF